MAKSENTETFYIRIKDPVALRRDLLAYAKGLIQVLRGYEKLKLIREEKLLAFESLSNVTKELDSLNTRLKTAFPSTRIDPDLRLPEPEKKKEKKKSDAREPRKKTEVEKLEAELDVIEKKLGQLA
ncbi:MAG: hypothetical protein ABH879_01155 [archaeon]